MVVEKSGLEIGDQKEDCMAVKTLFTFLEQAAFNMTKRSSNSPGLMQAISETVI